MHFQVSKSSVYYTSASALSHFPEHALQKADVLNGQLQNLALAQLLVQGVGGEQSAELGERAAHVLLTETLSEGWGDPKGCLHNLLHYGLK